MGKHRIVYVVMETTYWCYTTVHGVYSSQILANKSFEGAVSGQYPSTFSVVEHEEDLKVEK